ncbi:MAG: prephenate dehydrogenase/arogenate dehydrogenase family protein [Verrucomicrobiae bacterium]|nr:prephenate dehydrogenase/arogenate dehydrogenase family protein [Verrucomicrobiae bacterium]NNJ85724.1 prephenate dehydrogenase/arogenate dehydrogenase family protein [Akkermansiaceae bacterium]
MKRIALLGSGLLGGSIALAMQSRRPETQVALWGRRQQGVADAKARGIIESSTDLKAVVTGAEIIVLTSPVGAMLEILEAVTELVSLKDVIITDVGSVKLTPRDTLKDVVAAAGAKYIGSHPMAGSEQAGVSAAREDLFQDAACVITNDFQHSDEDLVKIQSMWESLGCKCHITSSEDHDRVMARISHLPHMLASVGALVGLKHQGDGKFAGNGMRDTTRVASGHPGMWAEIFMRNRAALKEPIEETINHLREMLALLENSSDEELTSFLQTAKELRDDLQ